MSVKIFLKPNENGKFIYYTGEKVQGTLQLILDKETKVKEVAVKMCGNSMVKIAIVYAFYESDKYLSEKLSLYESKDNAIMKPGCYNYQFEYTFQHNLPQSTELKNIEMFREYNSVNYYCEAILDMPWKLDSKFKHSFILKRRDDLNSFPILREPVTKHHKTNIFGIICCCPQKLLIDVSLPKSGFIPGEGIPMSIKIDNKSNTRVKQIVITLEEIRILKINNLKDYKFVSLVQNDMFGIEANSSDQISGILKIPDETRPSELLWSPTIKFKHYINVLAKTDGAHCNQRISIPIYIGSIPFADYPLPSQNVFNQTEIKMHLTGRKPTIWY